MSDILKRGSSGEGVVTLQQGLKQLGYDLTVDGKFGERTEEAVLHLQKTFGYDVDGKVGDGTQFLIRQQTALGWNRNAPAPAAASAKGGAPAEKGPAGDKSVAGSKVTKQ